VKVLHAPVVIADQSILIVKALRKVGVEAVSLQYYKNPQRFFADINIDIGRKRNIFKWVLIQLVNFPKFNNSYDIYHFHYSQTLLPFFIDLPILKLLRKRIVFEYHGSDIRPPFSYDSPLSFFMKLDLLFKIKLTRLVSKLFVDAEIVTTPDLLKFASSAKFIPAALETAKYETSSGTSKRKIVIAHAPTDRSIKGTSHVIEAVDKLKKKGFDLELDLVEGIDEKQVKKRYERADIAVDQLLIGWYGLFAVEMMSLGKPVICYISKDLEKFSSTLPIVNSNKETLVAEIERLVKDVESRKKLGRAGKVYVSKNHDSIKIAERLLELYKSL